MKVIESQLLVIFGASGDLTERKLLPALCELHAKGLLPANFAVLGTGRSEFTDESYREAMRPSMEKSFSQTDYTDSCISSFLDKVHYISFDSNSSAEYQKLKNRIIELQHKNSLDDRILYYLATPPVMYERIPAFLQENGMNEASSPSGWRRIIVEKPFGTSLDSAKKLNRQLAAIFNESDIYRIDHYLGKETVQNILVLRFSNGIFEPLWNRNYIDSIEISASETLGVERRGKYYDNAGALRDMVQNHLMQLMAFTAMEPPSAFDPEPIRDEIAKVFRSTRKFSPNEIDKYVVRGQYQGYITEKDVNPSSTTETYVAMKVFLDNWRWNGVPFYIYTGKNLPEKVSEIVVNFKNTPQQYFLGQCSGNSCNKLTIRIQPDEHITLQFGLKVPGAGFEVRQVGMDFRYNSISSERLPDAYERLLLDAMLGDSTLYARSDALEASWSFIDSILAHWRESGSKGLYHYSKGENGPKERESLEIPEYGCPCEIQKKTIS